MIYRSKRKRFDFENHHSYKCDFNSCMSKCKCHHNKHTCDCNHEYCKEECKYKPKCKCDFCKEHDQKSCKEVLTELIASAVKIENSLAEAISAESRVLKEGDFTAEELVVLTNNLENLLKHAIKKEIVLELLIEDATKACKPLKKHKHSCLE
ncbi:hypothetical protein [Oceanobacillus salinisoli]|uniref:hypothetical protein n=1 Tax=Oceanobacillus salinisoli TaxID=2678611 RepID=UPI0012E1BFC0|nr:hypothetical protein [Oceanobacillus salinisoli]